MKSDDLKLIIWKNIALYHGKKLQDIRELKGMGINGINGLGETKLEEILK